MGVPEHIYYCRSAFTDHTHQNKCVPTQWGRRCLPALSRRLPSHPPPISKANTPGRQGLRAPYRSHGGGGGVVGRRAGGAQQAGDPEALRVGVPQRGRHGGGHRDGAPRRAAGDGGHGGQEPLRLVRPLHARPHDQARQAQLRPGLRRRRGIYLIDHYRQLGRILFIR